MIPSLAWGHGREATPRELLASAVTLLSVAALGALFVLTAGGAW